MDAAEIDLSRAFVSGRVMWRFLAYARWMDFFEGYFEMAFAVHKGSRNI